MAGRTLRRLVDLSSFPVHYTTSEEAEGSVKPVAQRILVLERPGLAALAMAHDDLITENIAADDDYPIVPKWVVGASAAPLKPPPLPPMPASKTAQYDNPLSSAASRGPPVEDITILRKRTNELRTFIAEYKRAHPKLDKNTDLLIGTLQTMSVEIDGRRQAEVAAVKEIAALRSLISDTDRKHQQRHEEDKKQHEQHQQLIQRLKEEETRLAVQNTDLMAQNAALSQQLTAIRGSGESRVDRELGGLMEALDRTKDVEVSAAPIVSIPVPVPVSSATPPPPPVEIEVQEAGTPRPLASEVGDDQKSEAGGPALSVAASEAPSAAPSGFFAVAAAPAAEPAKQKGSKKKGPAVFVEPRRSGRVTKQTKLPNVSVPGDSIGEASELG